MAPDNRATYGDRSTVNVGDDLVPNARDNVNSVAGTQDTASVPSSVTPGDMPLSNGGSALTPNASYGLDVVGAAAGAQGAVPLGSGLMHGDSISQTVQDLQFILDTTAALEPNPSRPVANRRVKRGLVSQFDQALAANPGLTSWELTNALLEFHLSGSDEAALGSDLAYRYDRNDALAGIGLTAALDELTGASFGSEAQRLQPFSGLQEGFAKLG